jgi:2-methylcitrate dehydratase PrpD
MALKDTANGDCGTVPATTLLAEFVARASTSQLTPELRQKVKEVVIDWIGVTVGALDNAESTTSIYDAILTMQGGEFKGKNACTVVGKGEAHFLPQYAGLLNATFSHSLDFDDTYIDGTLHSGCTAVSATLTQAEVRASEVSTELFMLAIAVGYEVTCRIGRELGFEAYHRGFHNTSTAGIFGAVAAIAVLKQLPAQVIEMAWGLAGSKAAGSMQYLDNGSW